MVGGEAIGNTEIKERRKKKKKHAEEKRRALAGTFFVALLVFFTWCSSTYHFTVWVLLIIERENY